MDAIVKELKGLVNTIESLLDYAHVYPLDSDQTIELKQAQNRIIQIIKDL